MVSSRMWLCFRIVRPWKLIFYGIYSAFRITLKCRSGYVLVAFELCSRHYSKHSLYAWSVKRDARNGEIAHVCFYHKGMLECQMGSINASKHSSFSQFSISAKEEGATAHPTLPCFLKIRILFKVFHLPGSTRSIFHIKARGEWCGIGHYIS